MPNKLTSSEYFGGSVIRNITVVFGSLFSGIRVRKYNTDGSISEKTSLVPIAYAEKSQYGLWMDQKMRLPNGNIEINAKFPRISFELTGMAFANDRGMNTNIPIMNKEILPNGMQLRARTPISYSFNFELIVWAKQMDDSIQILEQIIPIFTPEISLKVKESKKLNIVNDIKIVLESCNKTDNYQNGFEENRIIQWTLNFTAYADFIPSTSISESSVIHQVIVDVSEMVIDDYINGKDPFAIRKPYGIDIRDNIS